MGEIISNMSSILVLVNLVILLLNTIITFCRKKGKTGSIEVEFERTEGNQDTFVLLDGIIQEGMKFAESLGVGGTAKKMIALAQISMKCVENDIDFNTIKDYVIQHIEELIDLTKTINYKEDK